MLRAAGGAEGSPSARVALLGWSGRGYSGKDSRMRPFTTLSAIIFMLPSQIFAQAGNPTGTDSWRQDLTKVERRIQEVRVEMGNRYEKKLGELRAGFQKLGDLENAVVIRDEERRLVGADIALDSQYIAQEPRALRDVQVELLMEQKKLLSQIVQESLAKLVELKKTLTVAGRLDEALEVRRSIADLQDIVSPAEKVENGTVVGAEDLYQTFQSSRLRADKMYKGRSLVLRGKVAGIRPDPRDSSVTVLVVFGGGDGMFIDCVFSGDYRVGEARQGGSVGYSVSKGLNDPNPVRLTRGAMVEISGRCEGWDAGVRFGNCSVLRR